MALCAQVSLNIMRVAEGCVVGMGIALGITTVVMITPLWQYRACTRSVLCSLQCRCALHELRGGVCFSLWNKPPGSRCTSLKFLQKKQKKSLENNSVCVFLLVLFFYFSFSDKMGLIITVVRMMSPNAHTHTRHTDALTALGPSAA